MSEHLKILGKIPTCLCGYRCKTDAGLKTHIKNADDTATLFRLDDDALARDFVKARGKVFNAVIRDIVKHEIEAYRKKVKGE